MKKTANTPHKTSRMDLGGFHITSTDFGYNKIVASAMLMEGDKVSSELTHSIIMTPLVAPSMGHCRIDFKSFFVPYKNCQESFNEWLTGQNYYNNGILTTPDLNWVTNKAICDLFLQSAQMIAHDSSLVSRGPWSNSRRINQIITPSPWSTQASIFDMGGGKLSTTPLLEVVGLCSGINSDGNVSTFIPVKKMDNTGKVVVGDRELNPDPSKYDVISLMPYAHTSNHGEYWGVPVAAWASCRSYVGSGAAPQDFLPYVAYKFTEDGKRLHDLFTALGYKLNWTCPQLASSLYAWASTSGNTVSVSSNGNVTTSGASIAATDLHAGATNLAKKQYMIAAKFAITDRIFDITKFNTLAIQAWCKSFLDHLCPRRYYDNYQDILMPLLQGVGNYWNPNHMIELVATLPTTYNEDYFGMSWETPNSLNNVHHHISIDTSLGNLNSHANDNNNISVQDTFVVGDTAAGAPLIPASTLRAVQALEKIRRSLNLSGYRPIDNLLARFGVRESSEAYQLSEIVGHEKHNIDVMKVISNSDTNSASLGDFVGNAESSGKSKLGKFEAKGYGHFIVCMSITPLPKYYQGRVRSNTYTDRNAFPQPEIDCCGLMQAVRQDEIFTGLFANQYDKVNQYKPNDSFGYNQFYCELKHGRDMITGDFLLNSRGKYSNAAYHMFREVDMPTSNTDLTISNNFVICKDASQYDRIFQYQGDDYDHFMCFLDCKIFVTRKLKGLNDFTIDDDDADKVFSVI